jgi:hypothetical protein
MNARAVTLPNGDVGWVMPEAVQFVRPSVKAEEWPESVNAVIYLASGQIVAVREECAVVIVRLSAPLSTRND